MADGIEVEAVEAAEVESFTCNGDGCRTEVFPEDPYFGTPCGTYCSGCMRRHMKSCEVCRNEFEG